MWQDKIWLSLCCCWHLICLPLTGIDGWEKATQKTTLTDAHKEVTANKRGTSRTEPWQLIKGRARNVAVINYAEGSIVCFCLLLQIIGRFKDMVGGGSSRLFILLCLLPPVPSHSPLLSWLCLSYGTQFTIPFSICYHVHYSFSNQAIKTAKSVQTQAMLVLSILAFMQWWSPFELRQFDLQRRLCNRTFCNRLFLITGYGAIWAAAPSFAVISVSDTRSCQSF